MSHRAQEHVLHRVQISGVCVTQGGELRSVYCTGCTAQQCISHRVQNSGVRVQQGAGSRAQEKISTCDSHMALGSGMHVAQGTEFRSACHTAWRAQECILHRMQGS